MPHPTAIPRQRGENNLDDNFATGTVQSFGYADKSVNYPSGLGDIIMKSTDSYLVGLLLRSYNDPTPTSETAATIQYADANLYYDINTETYLGIGMVEMVHRQRIGEAIVHFGGSDMMKVQAFNTSQILFGDSEEEFINIAIAAESSTILAYQNDIKTVQQRATAEKRELTAAEAWVIELLGKLISDETWHIKLLNQAKSNL